MGVSFDNIDHDRLIELLSLRIADRSLLRLIKKWLKAGVLDTDGKVIHPVSGTPQGGIVSPMLANVYLHYALDLWFQEVVKANMKGEACLIRYADDFVCAFEVEQDAKAFFKALGFRLEKFGLQLAADKTRVIHFSRTNMPGSSSFDFLGFEFRWDKRPRGQASRRAQNIPEETPQRDRRLHPVVQAESQRPAQRALPATEPEAPWVLQLLRSERQRCRDTRVLWADDEDSVEVVEQKKPAPEFQLARLQRPARSFRCATASNH